MNPLSKLVARRWRWARAPYTVYAVFALFALVAAACGDDDGASGTGDAEVDEAMSDESEPSGDAEVDEATSDDEAMSDESEPSGDAEVDEAMADESEPSGDAEVDEAMSDESEPSGEPILIGMIAPVGTAGFNFGPEVAAARAAVRGINEEGGIGGRPVELAFCNDGNEPNVSARCAQEMVDKGVIATAGNLNITSGAVVTTTLEEAGIPQIGTIALALEEFTNPAMFLLDGGSAGSFGAIAIKAIDLGYTRIGLVNRDIPASLITADLVEELVPLHGAEYVGEVRVATSATDLAPVAQEMIDLGADFVIVQLGGQETALLQAANQLGAEYEFGFTDSAFTAEQVETLGALLDNTVLSGPTPPLRAADEFPAVAEVIEELEAEHAAGNDEASLDNATGNSMRVWMAVKTVADAANQLGATDATSLLEALNSGATVETRMGDSWDPTRAGPEGFDRVSRPLAYAFVLIGGEAVFDTTEPYDVYAAV